MGRIMIPAKLREELNLTTGIEYTIRPFYQDGRKYLLVDCGSNTKLEEAIKYIQDLGLDVNSIH